MAFKINYTPKMLVCSCCGEEKPEFEFYRESYTDLPTGQCKQCINIKRRVTRDKAKHGKFVSKEKCRAMEVPDYGLEDWRAAMLHFKGACAFCGKPEGRAKKDKMDRDHLIPVSKGGKTVRKNVIPACRKCNRGRGNKDWHPWFVAQEFYSETRAELIKVWSEEG